MLAGSKASRVGTPCTCCRRQVDDAARPRSLPSPTTNGAGAVGRHRRRSAPPSPARRRSVRRRVARSSERQHPGALDGDDERHDSGRPIDRERTARSTTRPAGPTCIAQGRPTSAWCRPPDRSRRCDRSCSRTRRRRLPTATAAISPGPVVDGPALARRTTRSSATQPAATWRRSPAPTTRSPAMIGQSSPAPVELASPTACGPYGRPRRRRRRSSGDHGAIGVDRHCARCRRKRSPSSAAAARSARVPSGTPPTSGVAAEHPAQQRRARVRAIAFVARCIAAPRSRLVSWRSRPAASRRAVIAGGMSDAATTSSQRLARKRPSFERRAHRHERFVVGLDDAGVRDSSPCVDDRRAARRRTVARSAGTTYVDQRHRSSSARPTSGAAPRRARRMNGESSARSSTARVSRSRDRPAAPRRSAFSPGDRPRRSRGSRRPAVASGAPWSGDESVTTVAERRVRRSRRGRRPA